MIIAIAREVGDTTTAVEAARGGRNEMYCRGWSGLGLTEHRRVDGLDGGRQDESSRGDG